MDPRIADYIRANRRKYTREAITKQLVAAGHDPAEIERTWAALDTRDPDEVAGEGFWGRFALIVIGINVGVLLIVGLLTGMLQQVAAGGGFLLAILGVALAIGALIAWAIVAATGPTKMSPTTALVIGVAIPLLFALLIGGACYGLIGTVGLPPPPPSEGTMQLSLDDPLNLRDTVSAQCQPGGPDPDDGMSVWANVVLGDGRMVDVSIGSYPVAPGGPLQNHLWISVWQEATGEEAFPLQWSNETLSALQELDVTVTEDRGSVRFDDLLPMNEDPAAAPQPLSGEISWTCD